MDLKSCQHKCLETVTENELILVKTRFKHKSYPQKVEWIIEKMGESSSSNEVNVSFSFFAIAGGRNACRKCFCGFYGIHKNMYMYYKCRQLYILGAASTGYGRRKVKGDVYEIAYTWFAEYARCYGDQMPDENEILLPFSSSKTSIFEHFEAEQI